MIDALEAARAATHVCDLLSGTSPSATELHGMLYYAQGMTLAMTREPLFEDTFSAATSGVVSDALATFVVGEGEAWARHLGMRPLPADQATLDAFRDVHDAFGGWGSHGMSAAMRRERPWCRARGDLAWSDPSRPPVSRTDLHDHFGWFVECGEDEMEALGIPKDPDGPVWLRPYAVHVSVSYSVGHPLFSQTGCSSSDGYAPSHDSDGSRDPPHRSRPWIDSPGARTPRGTRGR